MENSIDFNFWNPPWVRLSMICWVTQITLTQNLAIIFLKTFIFCLLMLKPNLPGRVLVVREEKVWNPFSHLSDVSLSKLLITVLSCGELVLSEVPTSGPVRSVKIFGTLLRRLEPDWVVIGAGITQQTMGLQRLLHHLLQLWYYHLSTAPDKKYDALRPETLVSLWKSRKDSIFI